MARLCLLTAAKLLWKWSITFSLIQSSPFSWWNRKKQYIYIYIYIYTYTHTYILYSCLYLCIHAYKTVPSVWNVHFPNSSSSFSTWLIIPFFSDLSVSFLEYQVICLRIPGWFSLIRNISWSIYTLHYKTGIRICHVCPFWNWRPVGSVPRI